ncbi:MAG: RHS repeat-associated core domain-containing protein [Nitrospirota bacterium]
MSAIYEYTASGTKYLFAGSTRVAQKTSDGTVSYFHGNHLGSTHIVTNAGGAAVEEIHYYPYGGTYTDSNGEAGGVSYRYTSQQLDVETSLYYYHARYYDPVLGRFVSADNMGVTSMLPQSLNRYSYVLNNPLRFVDPTGHYVQADAAGNIVGIDQDGQLVVWTNPGPTMDQGKVYIANPSDPYSDGWRSFNDAFSSPDYNGLFTASPGEIEQRRIEQERWTRAYQATGRTSRKEVSTASSRRPMTLEVTSEAEWESSLRGDNLYENQFSVGSPSWCTGATCTDTSWQSYSLYGFEIGVDALDLRYGPPPEQMWGEPTKEVFVDLPYVGVGFDNAGGAHLHLGRTLGVGAGISTKLPATKPFNPDDLNKW